MASKLFVMVAFFLVSLADACPVLDSKGKRVAGNTDPLFLLLQLEQQCPSDVLELRRRLKDEGAALFPAMVANRGFHNPKLGSFSFFETVEIKTPRRLPHGVEKDEFFFGHFTAPGPGNTLTLDQDPVNSSLMIELIVWDRKIEMYRFYELLGSAQGSRWFYRGSSADIWADTERLHRKRKPQEAVFGDALRCSGCHTAGGPIVKELAKPNDSWWTEERPLPLAGRVPDAKMREVFDDVGSAEDFSKSVVEGVVRLQGGKAFAARLQQAPQVALRPLFCPEEVNFESGLAPLDGRETEILAPGGFFADPRLGATDGVRASKPFYIKALKDLGSRFPETTRSDADHPWLSPVKAFSDRNAIEVLVAKGRIDAEFVADVLAVDFTRPVFSQRRCELLQALPEAWGADWRKEFEENLSRSGFAAAAELKSNLTDATRTADLHHDRARRFVGACASKLGTEKGALDLVSYLGQARVEIAASEISANPRGKILEPGFRVIFPVYSAPPRPWVRSLDEACALR